MRHALVFFSLVCCVSLVLATGCPAPAKVTITSPASEVAVGATLQLNATSTDAQDEPFAWVSSSLQTAMVDETGLVTGLGLGQVLITARGSHSGRTASVQIAINAGGDFNVSLPVDPESIVPTQTVQSTDAASTCTLQTPDIAAEVRNEGGTLYHRLKLPGSGSSQEAGLPELPFYTLYFAVPRDAQTGEPASWSTTVKIVSERLYGGIRAYPAQPRAWIEGPITQEEGKISAAPEGERPAFTINEAFYQTTGPYPQGRTRSREYDMGNLHVVEIRVFPALYYPQVRQLRLARQLEVELQFSSPNGLIAPEVVGDFTARQEMGAEESFADLVANRERVRVFTAADLTATLPALDWLTVHDSFFELLVITRPALYSEALAYAHHKQDQGLRVYLASLDATTYPDADSIRDHIRALDAGNRIPTLDGRRWPYAMWALCLYGDTEFVPPCQGMNYRGIPIPVGDEPPVSIVGTDHLYGTVRDDDDIPDFAVGRISVQGDIQAGAVLAKIQNYEGHTDTPDHVAMYSYFTDEIWPLRWLTGIVTFTPGSATVTGTGTHFTTEISTADFVDYLAIEEPPGVWHGWFDVAAVVSDTELLLTAPVAAAHVVSGTTALGWRDGQDDWEFVKAAERARHFMVDRGVTARFGYTRTEGPTPVRGFDGSPLAADLLTYAWDVTAEDIKVNWRQGIDGIVLHSDHGERHGWQEPTYLRADIVALDDPVNGHFPIVFSVNCDTGWFDNETDTQIWGVDDIRPDGRTWPNDECFCERVVRFTDGGAVAAVGACRGSEACDNDKLVDGLFAAVYDDYVRGSVLTRHLPACTRLGPAFQWAKLHQHRGVESELYDRYNMQIWHLFGDPALRLNVPEPAARK